MSNPSRQTALTKVFVSGTSDIAGMKCRPFSLGTLSAARILGLTKIIGENDGPCKDWRIERQMTALLYIQSQPLEDVEKLIQLAASDFKKFDARLLTFEMQIPLDALNEFAAQLEADSGAVEAAQFDLESKPGERTETDPPNS